VWDKGNYKNLAPQKEFQGEAQAGRQKEKGLKERIFAIAQKIHKNKMKAPPFCKGAGLKNKTRKKVRSWLRG